MPGRRAGLALRMAAAALGIAAAMPADADARVPDASSPVWNLAADFRVAPEQANPNPDRLGNPRVWRFLESATLAHEPATYSLLPGFITDRFDVPGLHAWQGTLISISATDKLPSVSINARADNPRPYDIDWPPGVVLVHPLWDRLAVVGWRSPVRGTVRVSGEVRDRHACGDGIDWSVDRGATALASGVIPEGGRQTFAAGAGGTRLRAVQVAVGSVLYFVVGPGPDANHACDSTELDVTIRSRFDACPSGRPALSIAGTRAVVRYGSRARMSARLTCDARAVAGSALALERRLITPDRRGRWYRLGERTTRRGGTARRTDRPPVNVQYRWRLLDRGRPVLRSRATTVRVAPIVTASASGESERSVATRLVTGRVRPPHPGAAVALQRRGDKAWRTVARARLTAASRFRFAVRGRRPGVRRYRVRRPADSYHATGLSRTLTVELAVRP